MPATHHPIERRSSSDTELQADMSAAWSQVPLATANLGLRHRWLIELTTSPFRLVRDIAPRFRGSFARYQRTGWSLRVASPRNFVCWRDSRLIKKSDLPLAILPSRQFGLPGEEMAALCLFELLQRETRLGLLARGLPPRLADEPTAILWLQATVWHRLFEHEPAPELCMGFFAGLENGIGRAVVGRSAFSHRCCCPGGGV